MRLLALSVLVVAVTTALLVWACFRLVRNAETMERDPNLLRRRLLRGGLLYIGVAVLVIVWVATGDLPPIALLGLPITAAYAWTSIKAASNVKTPPL